MDAISFTDRSGSKLKGLASEGGSGKQRNVEDSASGTERVSNKPLVAKSQLQGKLGPTFGEVHT